MANRRLLINNPIIHKESGMVIVHNVLELDHVKYDLQSEMSYETYQYADVETVADYVVAGCLRLAIMNEKLIDYKR